MPDVHYKPAARYPGYRVGTDGSVWSTRSKSGNDDAEPHKLKPRPRGRKGRKYLAVTLYRDAECYQVYVHKLVLETFVGPCPAGMECRHIDGNRFNNVVENLAWGTKAENTKDQIAHGTFRNNLPAGKVDSDLLSRMMALAVEGYSRKEIAAKTGVSRGTVLRHLGSTRAKG